MKQNLEIIGFMIETDLAFTNCSRCHRTENQLFIMGTFPKIPLVPTSHYSAPLMKSNLLGKNYKTFDQ